MVPRTKNKLVVEDWLFFFFSGNILEIQEMKMEIYDSPRTSQYYSIIQLNEEDKAHQGTGYAEP